MSRAVLSLRRAPASLAGKDAGRRTACSHSLFKDDFCSQTECMCVGIDDGANGGGTLDRICIRGQLSRCFILRLYILSGQPEQEHSMNILVRRYESFTQSARHGVPSISKAHPPTNITASYRRKLKVTDVMTSR